MASIIQFEKTVKGWTSEHFYEISRLQLMENLIEQFQKDAQKQGINPITKINFLRESSFKTITFSLKLFSNVQILTSIHMNSKSDKIQISFVLFEGTNYLGPKSTQILKNLCKTLKTINMLINRTQNIFIVHPQNGQIGFKMMKNIRLNDQKKITVRNIKISITEAFKLLKAFSPIIIYSCNQIPLSYLKNQLPESIKSLYYGPNGQFFRFADLMELSVLINCEFQPKERQVKKRYHYTCQNSKRIIELFYSEHNSISLKNCLFSEPPMYIPERPINKDLTKQFFDKNLSFPAPKASVNDNPFIFNTISVKQVCKEKERLIGEGGKALIFAIPMKFTYTNSMNVFGNHPKEEIQAESEYINNVFCSVQANAVLQKIVVVKIPNKQNNKQRTEQIRYEKEILANLRGTTSAYLPKYYHSTQANFPYRQFLLMDHVSGYTLHEEMQLNKPTMTHFSKLHILTHLSNAIRFLDKYEIAHLDLSPNNILVVRDKLIKIIDFGQAYSPFTAKKYLNAEKNSKGNPFKYMPGKTYPYAPPQTSSRSKDFTSQQDMFSLGMIMFKLFFGYFPLPYSQSLNEKWYRQNTYMNRIFFAPQQMEHYAQKQFTNMVIYLIFKLLHSQQEMRPLPIWINILLKKLFYTLR